MVNVKQRTKRSQNADGHKNETKNCKSELKKRVILSNQFCLNFFKMFCASF